MRPAEFEEKDFEGPLYNQLLAGSSNVATPGQVFEGQFGVDAALDVRNRTFWNGFGYPAPPRGVVLNHYRWGFIWHRLGRKRTLPNFSVNALIQAKRPDVLEGRRFAFSSLGIIGRYWRFFVTPHQQQILERVSQVLGNRALVVYASPAFDTFDELYDLTSTGQIVDRSAFVKVRRMSEHASWNYNVPGTTGIAESDPEAVREPPLDQQIRGLLESYHHDADPRKELQEFYRALLGVCKKASEGNALARYFLKRHNQMHEVLTRAVTREPELVLHFLGTVLFCDSANVMWLPIGPE